jgi:hypothetical protein
LRGAGAEVQQHVETTVEGCDAAMACVAAAVAPMLDLPQPCRRYNDRA